MNKHSQRATRIQAHLGMCVIGDGRQEGSQIKWESSRNWRAGNRFSGTESRQTYWGSDKANKSGTGRVENRRTGRA